MRRYFYPLTRAPGAMPSRLLDCRRGPTASSSSSSSSSVFFSSYNSLSSNLENLRADETPHLLIIIKFGIVFTIRNLFLRLHLPFFLFTFRIETWKHKLFYEYNKYFSSSVGISDGVNFIGHYGNCNWGAALFHFYFFFSVQTVDISFPFFLNCIVNWNDSDDWFVIYCWWRKVPIFHAQLFLVRWSWWQLCNFLFLNYSICLFVDL